MNTELNEESISPPSWSEPLTTLMKTRKVRQQDLAGLLEVSRGSIGHYLNGRRTPDRKQLTLLMGAVDLDVESAFRGEIQQFSKLARAQAFAFEAPTLPVTQDEYEQLSIHVGIVRSIERAAVDRLGVLQKIKQLGFFNSWHATIEEHLGYTKQLCDEQFKRVHERMVEIEEIIKADPEGFEEFQEDVLKLRRKTDIRDATIAPAYSNLPIISSVQAGDWMESFDAFEPGDADNWEVLPGTFGPHAFVLTVEGDSMTSSSGGVSIPAGSKVAVEPDAEPTSGSIVVAKLEDSDQVTLKKLIIDPPYKYLMPLNERYDRINIEENCRIIGVVKKVIQDV